jgi:anti-sigma regulatory factor (Ser/Thr protein kinase)
VSPERSPWPAPLHFDELELWPLPTAVGSARRHAGAILREWGLALVVDDAALVISELVTNAVVAATKTTEVQPIKLRLFGFDDWLVIEVWDASPEVPEPQSANADATSGRGLMIVEALSERYGYDVTPDGRKAVWAHLLI